MWELNYFQLRSLVANVLLAEWLYLFKLKGERREWPYFLQISYWSTLFMYISSQSWKQVPYCMYSRYRSELDVRSKMNRSGSLHVNPNYPHNTWVLGSKQTKGLYVSTLHQTLFFSMSAQVTYQCSHYLFINSPLLPWCWPTISM